MKRVYLYAVIILSAIFTDCAPSQQYTGVWVNKEKIEGKKKVQQRKR